VSALAGKGAAEMSAAMLLALAGSIFMAAGMISMVIAIVYVHHISWLFAGVGYMAGSFMLWTSQYA
jgi:hypothetical protein